MDFISEFLGIIGGTVVILHALVSFIASIWKQRVGSKEQANHSIAKDAYAEFFASKIQAYIQLANLKRDFLLSQKEYVHDPMDIPLNNNAISLMLTLRKTIHANNIYLSEDLVEKFDKWNEEFIKIDKINTMDIMQRWSYFSQIADEYGDSANILANEETRLTYQSFLNDNSKLWDTVLETIGSDVRKLRNRYDL